MARSAVGGKQQFLAGQLERSGMREFGFPIAQIDAFDFGKRYDEAAPLHQPVVVADFLARDDDSVRILPLQVPDAERGAPEQQPTDSCAEIQVP
jgi:hypothetical protein